jgi:hypothetical protein
MHSRSLAWDTAAARSQYRQTILPSPGDPDVVTAGFAPFDVRFPVRTPRYLLW